MHARTTSLPQHLRTCHCPDIGCTSHPRHRGCDGTILLALTHRRGSWRLTDLCHACATATSHTAPVAEPVPRRPALPSPEREEELAWNAEESGAEWPA
ncbi:hypothetical protein ACWGJ2_33010 [Streptomyces sp. NPDC054796]